jgi:ferrous iron transport protein B
MNKLDLKASHGCCGPKEDIGEGLRKIAIVGNPNVGKSLLFNCLTGTYVNVSNYPGTTVEIFRSRAKLGEEEFEVIDTPGMYSFMPITEEEGIARRVLFEQAPALVLHVIDTKNLERMLSLTLELIEARLPVILVLNMFDEAKKTGMTIDVSHLETTLGIPVIPTISTTGWGIDALKEAIEKYV